MDSQSKSTLLGAAISGILAASVGLSAGAGNSAPAENPKNSETTASSGMGGGKVKCLGVNDCKGQGECGEIINGKVKDACMGMNSCKGKSFKWVANEEACKAIKVAQQKKSKIKGAKKKSK